MTKGLIVGTGPSLRGVAHLIPEFDGLVFGCNNTYQDFKLSVHLSCDPKWHERYSPISPEWGDFACWHWDKGICDKYGYRYVEGVWVDGLYLGPENKISLNHCSGAQLLNLAAGNQYACDEIILVGHDFKYPPGVPRHYFTGLSDTDGEYVPELRKWSLFDKRKHGGGNDLRMVYKKIAETPGLPRIINCTPDSALPWFEMGNFGDYCG
jgi:hypothetical protein